MANMIVKIMFNYSGVECYIYTCTCDCIIVDCACVCTTT